MLRVGHGVAHKRAVAGGGNDGGHDGDGGGEDGGGHGEGCGVDGVDVERKRG